MGSRQNEDLEERGGNIGDLGKWSVVPLALGTWIVSCNSGEEGWAAVLVQANAC